MAKNVKITPPKKYPLYSVHTYIICTCGGEGGDTPTGVALYLSTVCPQQKDEWGKSSHTHNGVLVCS